MPKALVAATAPLANSRSGAARGASPLMVSAEELTPKQPLRATRLATAVAARASRGRRRLGRVHGAEVWGSGKDMVGLRGPNAGSGLRGLNGSGHGTIKTP